MTIEELEQQGIERTFITAGEHKVPFEDDGSFNKEFLDRIQTSVSKTYDKFVSTVADLRQLPKDKIIDTQARVYSSDEALSLGLIDKIMEFEDFEKLKLISSNINEISLIVCLIFIPIVLMQFQKQ